MIVALALLSGPAGAGLVKLEPCSFTAAAPVLVFDMASGTIDPTYSLSAVPGLGDGIASFDDYLLGRNREGTPTSAGTIAVQLRTPVAGMGRQAGYFDTVASTTTEAYEAAGNSLSTMGNGQLGPEFCGPADSTGQNLLRGGSFHLTGEEPPGYAIKDVAFGAAEVIVPVAPGPPGPMIIPTPTALILAALGSGLVGLIRRRNLL